MSDRDDGEFAGEKGNRENGVRNFDSLHTSPDWRVSVAPYHLEHPISMVGSSFRQNLCHDGGGGFNVVDAGGEMGWSMAEFPADSGFIERAARCSLFGSGSFSEMMMVNNHHHHQSLAVVHPPESDGLFLQATQVACGSNLGSGSSKVAKFRSNKPSNLSEGSESSGGNGYAKCGETWSSKKRKRTVKDTELDQSQRAQGSGEGEEEGKKKDEYIHMRAPRGQATNSHSLAERVRREKISERMKFLQDLVPGCDKVTGKAVMLDEIINYVQSLQCQIEFLSMKLSAVNPLLDSNLESLLAKDAFQLSAPTFPQNMSMLYHPLAYIPQTTGIMQTNLSSVSSLNVELKRQETHGHESDLHDVVHMSHGTGTAPDHEDATALAEVIT